MSHGIVQMAEQSAKYSASGCIFDVVRNPFVLHFFQPLNRIQVNTILIVNITARVTASNNFAPSCMAFSIAYVETFPDPDTTTV